MINFFIGYSVLFLIGILIKLVFYIFDYKVFKYGIKREAVIIGYDYNYDNFYGKFNIEFYPIVKFLDINGKKIFARINNFCYFPLYKINDKAIIRYYKKESVEVINKEIYVQRFGNLKEDVEISTNIKCVFVDIKHNIKGILIGLVILMILGLIL